MLQIIHLYKDPKGEKLFNTAQTNPTVAVSNPHASSSNSVTLNTVNGVEEESDLHLRHRVQELEEQLEERDRVIGQLQQKTGLVMTHGVLVLQSTNIG